MAISHNKDMGNIPLATGTLDIACLVGNGMPGHVVISLDQEVIASGENAVQCSIPKEKLKPGKRLMIVAVVTDFSPATFAIVTVSMNSADPAKRHLVEREPTKDGDNVVFVLNGTLS